MKFALLSIVFNAFAQLSLKQLSNSKIEVLGLLRNPYFYLSGSLYIFSIFFWVVALKKIDLSVAYPLQSLGYILVFVFGIFLFGESFTGIKIFGLSLIVLGAILITRGFAA